MLKLTTSFLLLLLPFFGHNSYHKYYTSITQVKHVPKKNSVQIISRIFTDDLEHVLRKRYFKSITLNPNKESTNADVYIKKYMLDKIKVTINHQNRNLKFIGKRYDDGIVKCYLEVENIEQIKSFEFTNMALFDVFDEQQNIIKTNINSKQKSFTLTPQHKKALLEF